MTDKYRDIIDLPRHISTRHARMPVSGRAAQFAPFSSLRGYERGIEEAQRVNEEKYKTKTGDVWVC